MKPAVCLAAALLLAAVVPAALAQSAPEHDILNRDYRPLAGREPVNLRQSYGGEVLLVINTASKCGFTPQFDALEALHAKYREQGFAVLGFPSGDFREQEFDDEGEILEFCRLTYGVQFPMFEKVHVIGTEVTGLYRDLSAATNAPPRWNFHKYLLDRTGRVIGHWPSRTTPDAPELVQAIERALAEPRPAPSPRTSAAAPLPVR